MTTKYILHGGFTRILNEQNKKFMEEVVKDVPNGGQLLIIYFAREDVEYSKLIKQDEQPFKDAAKSKEIKIIVASKDNFIEELKSSDAIYIRGGETEKLLAEIKKYPEFENLINGKTVAGSSAGAYLLSKYYHSASKGSVYEGLGIIPIRIICHFESDKFDYGKGNPITLMEKYPQDLKLLILKDFESEIINQESK